ncbi:hypothetical protein C922_00548 [Plasmodium inui San Antonio 1]|uniref:Uncharacterized protein n=1 Tax=Plasmodium inui San Antonio 1 TaxID=1237626 RepID=W7AAV4_9APIC|nr:hypothetical protein C922_00548 [Plasmodium inui San Antonio 1]EUD68860.1 hypothetical protein C922_00548 [Plasmodium inui San Antonio 1]
MQTNAEISGMKENCGGEQHLEGNYKVCKATNGIYNNEMNHYDGHYEENYDVHYDENFDRHYDENFDRHYAGHYEENCEENYKENYGENYEQQYDEQYDEQYEEHYLSVREENDNPRNLTQESNHSSDENYYPNSLNEMNNYNSALLADKDNHENSTKNEYEMDTLDNYVLANGTDSYGAKPYDCVVTENGKSVVSMNGTVTNQSKLMTPKNFGYGVSIGNSSLGSVGMGQMGDTNHAGFINGVSPMETMSFIGNMGVVNGMSGLNGMHRMSCISGENEANDGGKLGGAQATNNFAQNENPNFMNNHFLSKSKMYSGESNHMDDPNVEGGHMVSMNGHMSGHMNSNSANGIISTNFQTYAPMYYETNTASQDNMNSNPYDGDGNYLTNYARDDMAMRDGPRNESFKENEEEIMNNSVDDYYEKGNEQHGYLHQSQEGTPGESYLPYNTASYGYSDARGNNFSNSSRNSGSNNGNNNRSNNNYAVSPYMNNADGGYIDANGGSYAYEVDANNGLYMNGYNGNLCDTYVNVMNGMGSSVIRGNFNATPAATRSKA